MVSQGSILQRQISGNILDRLAGQRLPYDARPEFLVYFLLILGRQRQHDIAGMR
jgi:hypothetical protein